ncbi:hypothetical protein [Pseudomonas bijieensis]|uniref:hypothetical protein n=1 Tax=Pseudomonas bijieensis TaxID=2681983 RepID=UPI001E3F14E4|nr:hypothetical protein [Pseudomonas bijieensis]MCD9116906.1 hypothetical protein [Pseudomonas bijieensis]
MGKIKELDELKELARLATYEALKGYEPLPEEWEKNLTLGTFFDDEHRVFELYVASEKPEDTIVISSARVNRLTKSVHVTVSNLAEKTPQSEVF